MAACSSSAGEGASNAILASAEVFDPTTGAFSPVATMSVTRQGHTATRLATDDVLVTGGFEPPPSRGVSSAEVFVPALSAFVTVGSLGVARGASAVVYAGVRKPVPASGNDGDVRGDRRSGQLNDRVVHGVRHGRVESAGRHHPTDQRMESAARWRGTGRPAVRGQAAPASGTPDSRLRAHRRLDASGSGHDGQGADFGAGIPAAHPPCTDTIRGRLLTLDDAMNSNWPPVSAPARAIRAWRR